MDFLSKTIGSITGSGFPFNTGEKIQDAEETTFPGIWSIHEGTLKV